MSKLDKFIDFMQTEHSCKELLSKAQKIICSSLLTIVLAAGCASDKPQNRVGYLPTLMPPLIPSTSFASQVESESCTLYRGAIAYTLYGGFVDLDHLLETAEWTRYLAQQTQKHLMNNETDFFFQLHEPARYFVHINYPDYWKNLPQQEKENIVHEISIALGQDFAFTGAVWHEITTWFGYKAMLVPSEFLSAFSLKDPVSILDGLHGFRYKLSLFRSDSPSAFSWEDPFSGLLGSRVGAQALQDTEHSPDEAINIALDRELKTLGVQPKYVAKKASEKVKGNPLNWYFIHYFPFSVSMKKRNLNIGLKNGSITPWLVPYLNKGEQPKPQPYPVPDLGCLPKHGFSVELEIEPRESIGPRILDIIYSDKRNTRDKKNTRIQPHIHFPLIMREIERQAVEKYGPNVDNPYSD